MKKIYVICIVALSCIISSCSTSRKVNKSIEDVVGTEVVVSIPFKPSSVGDTKNMYRAVGNGVSRDWIVAKNIALASCRGELSNKLKVQVKQAIENYAEQYAIDGKTEMVERALDEHFEQYTITYSNVLLTNVNEIETVTTRNSKTFEYTHWVAMEVNKSVFADETVEIFDSMSDNTKRDIKYNRDEFRKYLETNHF